MKRILATGSSGLIGSAVCAAFDGLGYEVHGLDNDQRAAFFGAAGSTRANQARLAADLHAFTHHEMDVRDRRGVAELVATLRPDVVFHAAGQPSHDLAASMPHADFEINAVGTLNLLEACRAWCAEAPFIFMSTNKVYGDRPNLIPRRELPTRYDFDDAHAMGVSESLSIDQSCHSIFGASKVAADVMVQEYGRLFGMPTCCLRAGCVTGANHAGVQLHGFLNYLVACNAEGRRYSVFGHNGKQVRDNIHADDVARFAVEFVKAPRSGEVYNIGGGAANTCSILEAFELAQAATGRPSGWSYDPTPRAGDHVVYYSNLSKIKQHYPAWSVSVSLPQIFEEIAMREVAR